MTGPVACVVRMRGFAPFVVDIGYEDIEMSLNV